MRGEVIELQDIFLFKEEGFDKNRKIQGSFKWTGNMPKCIEKFEKRGIAIPRHIFANAEEAKRDSIPATTTTPKRARLGTPKTAQKSATSEAKPTSIGAKPPLKKVSGGN